MGGGICVCLCVFYLTYSGQAKWEEGIINVIIKIGEIGIQNLAA